MRETALIASLNGRTGPRAMSAGARAGVRLRSRPAGTVASAVETRGSMQDRSGSGGSRVARSSPTSPSSALDTRIGS